MGFLSDLFSCCSSGRNGVDVEDFQKEEISLECADSVPLEEIEQESTTKALLPPKYDDLPTLVLDLDSTLVFSTYEETENYDYRILMEGKETAIAIFVKERPFLRTFLRQLAEKYEIVIFTASKEKYAAQVINRFGNNDYIKHSLFRESCTLVDGNYVKDLSLLGRDLDKTIIVDDARIAFSLQPLNGIHIKPYFGEESDIELKVLCNRLLELSNCKNLIEKLNQN